MSATTNTRASREPITAPATTPVLEGSSKASAEGMKGLKEGVEKWVEEKKKEGIDGCFGGGIHSSSCIVSVHVCYNPLTSVW